MRLGVRHCLPALLLVLCQTLLLVHQADIDAHAHGGHCSICLQAHGLDSAPPAAIVVSAHKPVAIIPPSFVVAGCSRPAEGFYFSRAPPLHPQPLS